ncbi:Conidiation protein 6-domain-containing protein [Crassisporium funariophilum]|nr:Conidiation protein 6-domain-containing protein [Crassisporium funariophilum]
MSASTNRQAGGLKATISNPRTSQEAKDSAKERLEDLSANQDNSDEYDDSGRDGVTAGKNTGNVIGGYKATLKNPRVSDEAKQNAEEVLKEHDAL